MRPMRSICKFKESMEMKVIEQIKIFAINSDLRYNHKWKKKTDFYWKFVMKCYLWAEPCNKDSLMFLVKLLIIQKKILIYIT